MIDTRSGHAERYHGRPRHPHLRSSFRERPSLLDRWLLAVLCVLVVLAAVPLGANRPWAWNLLGILVALLALFTFALDGLGRVGSQVRLRPVMVPIVLWLLICAWGAAQAFLPVPPSLAHPLWAEAGTLLDRELNGRISIDPHDSWTGVQRLLTYGLCFLIAYRLAGTRGQAGRTLTMLTVGNALIAIYGLIVFALGNDTILLFQKWAYQDNLTATFVNRNHYAMYAGMGAMMALGLATADRESGKVTVVPWICLAVAVLAMFLTASRGGVLAATLGLVALVIMTVPGRTIHRVAAVGVVLIVLAGVFLLFGDVLQKRAVEGDSFLVRLGFWKGSLELLGERPILGTGLSTFDSVFHPFKPVQHLNFSVSSAHNTYIENAIELGIPAAAIMLAAVSWPFVMCLSGGTKRPHGRALRKTAAAVALALGAHAIVDFSLQIPAISASFAVLLGAGAAQAARLDRTGGERDGRGLSRLG